MMHIALVRTHCEWVEQRGRLINMSFDKSVFCCFDHIAFENCPTNNITMSQNTNVGTVILFWVKLSKHLVQKKTNLEK